MCDDCELELDVNIILGEPTAHCSTLPKAS